MTCAGSVAGLAAWAEEFRGFIGWALSARGRVLCVYEEIYARKDETPTVVFRAIRRDKNGHPHRKELATISGRRLVTGTWPVPLESVRSGWKYTGPYRPKDYLPPEALPELLVQRDWWLGAR